MSHPVQKPKIIVVLGPTAVGKSNLGVWLSKHIHGEIVSADSRQVYRGLDIGSGKVTKQEMAGVPHHLLSVASPRRQFSVADYQKHAQRAISLIIASGKIPVIVGGSPFYLSAIADGVVIPEVPPNPSLRETLERKSAEELFAALRKKDPRRAENIDRHNKRRLIRALEIIDTLGVVPSFPQHALPYEVLKIGLDMPDENLKEKIHLRLKKRLRRGMVAEVQRLHENGLSWKRLEALGLEYRYCAQYLRGKITKEELIPQLCSATWDFVRRQRTWWKQDKTIVWFRPSERSKILQSVKEFVSS